MLNSLSKNAFTLAEVLVTLGIIGVVAALTIPALIANYRNMVLENQFKKSYSILSQALISTKEELGENLHQNYILGQQEGWNGSVEFRETYFKYLAKLSPIQDLIYLLILMAAKSLTGQVMMFFYLLLMQSRTSLYPGLMTKVIVIKQQKLQVITAEPVLILL